MNHGRNTSVSFEYGRVTLKFTVDPFVTGILTLQLAKVSVSTTTECLFWDASKSGVCSICRHHKIDVRTGGDEVFHHISVHALDHNKKRCHPSLRRKVKQSSVPVMNFATIGAYLWRLFGREVCVHLRQCR